MSPAIDISTATNMTNNSDQTIWRTPLVHTWRYVSWW